MKNKIRFLPWDTDFFGYKVGRIIPSRFQSEELLHLISGARKERYYLLYGFFDPTDFTTRIAAEECRGVLVDEKITYIKKISSKDTLHKDPSIFSYKNHIASKNLNNLAVQAGVYSRFQTDSHFTQESFQKLYREWLHNSLNGKLAEDVFVYVKDSKEVGLITLGEKDGKADIGLLSVDTTVRGEGIGTKLIKHAFSAARELGFQEIQVVTQQKNISACRLYEKCEFRKDHLENVYHFWLTESNENSL